MSKQEEVHRPNNRLKNCGKLIRKLEYQRKPKRKFNRNPKHTTS